jgi:hypothetical protein
LEVTDDPVAQAQAGQAAQQHRQVVDRLDDQVVADGRPDQRIGVDGLDVAGAVRAIWMERARWWMK